jgi:hypothetical protein
MKTVAFNGSRKNIARTLFVLAALGGLYYMRRQGKSARSLMEDAKSGLKSARGFIGRAAPMISGRSVDSTMDSSERSSGRSNGRASRSSDSVASNAQI